MILAWLCRFKVPDVEVVILYRILIMCVILPN